MNQISNIRIKAFKKIASPEEILKKVPITKNAKETVIGARMAVENVLDGKDKRKIVVVGPCSIHNYDEAVEYAEKLNALRKKVEDKMVVIMRAYLEKPRTTVGWKGFIYDPYLDDSYS
ncbi:3-deoxy-7-phosphoheptulonate synthase, partial [Candidatus Peregrinibacteria bacterium]|nr:3-deoxy-7-phosphoheptulonate synthase [Candidatus Peregrinibacteria bacterium]